LPADDLEENRAPRALAPRLRERADPLRLTEEEIARFAVHRFEFPGVDIATRLTRFYPHGEHAVHALGYVAAISEADVKNLEKEKQLAKYAGTSLIGKLGIEASYEPALHGTDGSRQILVNAAGRSVQRQGALTPELQETKPLAGSDVITSIDLPTQLVAEEGLTGRRGAVVAIDPNNGDVLALVSTPGFDPNPFTRGLTRAEYDALRDNIDVPLLNRALRGQYPSGSTIKPGLALAGLVYHDVDPNATKFCPGIWRLPGSSLAFREAKPAVMARWTCAMRSPSPATCTSTVSPTTSAWITSPSSRAARLRQPHRYRHRRRETGPAAVEGMEAQDIQASRGPGLVPGETVNFGVGQGYFLVTPLQLAHYTRSSRIAARLINRGS
jgi:penicillin-binding protein 2